MQHWIGPSWRGFEPLNRPDLFPNVGPKTDSLLQNLIEVHGHSSGAYLESLVTILRQPENFHHFVQPLSVSQSVTEMSLNAAQSLNFMTNYD